MASQGDQKTDLELVIGRAIELSDPSSELAPLHDLSVEHVSSEALEHVAQELGVSRGALAQALAERQSGADRSRSLSDRLLGPARVSASGRCGVPEDATAERMQRWLERGHGLRTRSGGDGLVLASPKRGVVAKVGSSVRKARGTGGLGRSQEVRASVVSVGDKNDTGVSLVVNLAAQRSKAAALGAGVAAGGAGLTVLVLEAAAVSFAAIPVALGLGLVTSRFRHRSTVRRFEEETEQTVDAVLEGADPHTAGAIVDRLRSLRKP